MQQTELYVPGTVLDAKVNRSDTHRACPHGARSPWEGRSHQGTKWLELDYSSCGAYRIEAGQSEHVQKEAPALFWSPEEASSRNMEQSCAVQEQRAGALGSGHRAGWEELRGTACGWDALSERPMVQKEAGGGRTGLTRDFGLYPQSPGDQVEGSEEANSGTPASC